jgi:hypothetical protein
MPDAKRVKYETGGQLHAGKAAPFTYYGKVRYRSHSGANPMSIIFKLTEDHVLKFSNDPA